VTRDKWRTIGVVKGDPRERRLARDLDAYRRLRREGLQPPSTDGAARLEAEAVTKAEIETGVVRRDMKPAERRRLAEAMKELAIRE